MLNEARIEHNTNIIEYSWAQATQNSGKILTFHYLKFLYFLRLDFNRSTATKGWIIVWTSTGWFQNWGRASNCNSFNNSSLCRWSSSTRWSQRSDRKSQRNDAEICHASFAGLKYLFCKLYRFEIFVIQALQVRNNIWLGSTHTVGIRIRTIQRLDRLNTGIVNSLFISPL